MVAEEVEFFFELSVDDVVTVVAEVELLVTINLDPELKNSFSPLTSDVRTRENSPIMTPISMMLSASSPMTIFWAKSVRRTKLEVLLELDEVAAAVDDEEEFWLLVLLLWFIGAETESVGGEDNDEEADCKMSPLFDGVLFPM